MPWDLLLGAPQSPACPFPMHLHDTAQRPHIRLGAVPLPQQHLRGQVVGGSTYCPVGRHRIKSMLLSSHFLEWEIQLAACFQPPPPTLSSPPAPRAQQQLLQASCGE